MRQLHVVALSEDGKSVLLATSKTAKTGAFSLPLDATLSAALRGDVPRTGEREVRDTGVSPKEIQARLRAGESPQQIADAAGVPVARVDRFAGPVLSERERIIEEARAAFVTRNRRGLSQLPLGDAVDSALAETSGLRPETTTWTARRLESGHWLVQVSYVARARTRTASWVFEPHVRSVTPSDSPSAALGHVGEESAPGRAAPRRAATTRPPARKKAAAQSAAKAPAKAAPARKATAAKKQVAAPSRTGKVVAGKAVGKKAPARAAAPKPAPKRAATAAPRKAAVAKAAVAKAAPRKAATKLAPAKATARKAAPTKAAVTSAPAQATRQKAKTAARTSTPRTLRRSAAAEELASTPVVKWGPPVDPAARLVETAGPLVDTAGPPNLRVVPAPEPDPVPVTEPTAPAEPAAAAVVPGPKRRAANERAHVPDWADVLLGATPKRTDD